MREFSIHPRLRVATISIAATGLVVRGLGYTGSASPAQISFIDSYIPAGVWAIVWIGTGAALVAGIWHRVIARWAMSAGAALWGLWSLSYVVAWLAGESSRAWLTAGAMATICGFMWILAALMDSVGPPPRPVTATPLPVGEE